MLAHHDPDGEDHEGPAASEAIACMMLDVRSIKGMIESYLIALSKAASRRG